MASAKAAMAPAADDTGVGRGTVPSGGAGGRVRPPCTCSVIPDRPRTVPRRPRPKDTILSPPAPVQLPSRELSTVVITRRVSVRVATARNGSSRSRARSSSSSPSHQQTTTASTAPEPVNTSTSSSTTSGGSMAKPVRSRGLAWGAPGTRSRTAGRRSSRAGSPTVSSLSVSLTAAATPPDDEITATSCTARQRSRGNWASSWALSRRSSTSRATTTPASRNPTS